MAVFVIGDIHGELDPLERLVDRVNPCPDDIIVQLGDCVNRGPHSFEVVEYWLNFDRCDRFVIGGNHEELIFEYLMEDSKSLYGYGGKSTIASYRRNGWDCRVGEPWSVPESHLKFYSQMLPWTRPFLLTSQYLFTHSGYNFTLPNSKQDVYTLRWGHIVGWEPGKPTVVRGHTPHSRVNVGADVIQVDTGCGMGGRLSCLCLQTGQTWSTAPRRPKRDSLFA